MSSTQTLHAPNTRSSTQLVAGALAQLAAHLGSSCPRAAHRASLLLAEIAADTAADAQLRLEADALRDVLDDGNEPASSSYGRHEAGSRR